MSAPFMRREPHRKMRWLGDQHLPAFRLPSCFVKEEKSKR